MQLLIPLLFVLLALAGCAKEVPAIPDVTSAPAEWLAPAAPLPDVPACGHLKAERERVACRAAYDEQTRGQYVDLAIRHGALAAYTARVAAAKPSP